MKQHLVFQTITQGSRWVGVLEKIFLYVPSDPNHGLPNYIFGRDDVVLFELNLKEGTVEWTPPCGPAPCWKARYADFKTHHDMIEAWDKWAKETY